MSFIFSCLSEKSLSPKVVFYSRIGQLTSPHVALFHHFLRNLIILLRLFKMKKILIDDTLNFIASHPLCLQANVGSRMFKNILGQVLFARSIRNSLNILLFSS